MKAQQELLRDEQADLEVAPKDLRRVAAAGPGRTQTTTVTVTSAHAHAASEEGVGENPSPDQEWPTSNAARIWTIIRLQAHCGRPHIGRCQPAVVTLVGQHVLEGGAGAWRLIPPVPAHHQGSKDPSAPARCVASPPYFSTGDPAWRGLPMRGLLRLDVLLTTGRLDDIPWNERARLHARILELRTIQREAWLYTADGTPQGDLLVRTQRPK